MAATTIFFLTLFLLYELPGIARVALSQIPQRRRPRVIAAANHMNRNIGGYVAGNLVISLICGTVTTVSLYLLDVPYAGARRLHGGLRPDTARGRDDRIRGRDRVGARLRGRARRAVIMFAIVMIYQQIENHILQPLIYGKTVQIPSLTVLVAVLCGGAALGLIGALLAIPIAGTIQAVVSELLEERAERMNNELPRFGN